MTFTPRLLLLLLLAFAVAAWTLVCASSAHVAATAAPPSAEVPGVFGVDVSNPISQSAFECMATQHAVKYTIIRAYRSLGLPDENCPATAAAARAAGINDIDVYHFPDTSQDAATQVKTSLAFLQTHGVKFGRYWLDIERFAWSSNTTLNTVFIGDMVATLRSQGVTNIGVYSGRYSWPAITGDTHKFDSLPLWYAHYEQPPNPSFSDYFAEGPYGGWKTPYMKQYAGTASLCGDAPDLDWRPSL